MRRNLTKMIQILCLALVLAGCGEEQITLPAESVPAVVTEPLVETMVPADTTLPSETQEPTDDPTEAPAAEAPATEVPTEPAATEAPDDGMPYLQRIDRADQSIYDGPGYDYVFVGTVRERGTYTIVEEQWDQEGNLWGKLKSGAGWVNLTQIRSADYAEALISANYAEENLLLHGDYHYCGSDEPEYSIAIAFRAYGKIRDVQLCAFEMVGDQMVLSEAFFTLSEMTEEKPLVAELAFPGDMSMYGIRFTDEDGVTHIYSIYISGRNGALILDKWA